MTEPGKATKHYCCCNHCGALLKISIDAETLELVAQCPGCRALWMGKEQTATEPPGPNLSEMLEQFVSRIFLVNYLVPDQISYSPLDDEGRLHGDRPSAFVSQTAGAAIPLRCDDQLKSGQLKAIGKFGLGGNENGLFVRYTAWRWDNGEYTVEMEG